MNTIVYIFIVVSIVVINIKASVSTLFFYDCSHICAVIGPGIWLSLQTLLTWYSLALTFQNPQNIVKTMRYIM